MKSFERFLDNHDSFIVVVDVYDKILFCNKITAELAGLSAEKIIGKHFLDFFDKISGLDIEIVIPLPGNGDGIAGRAVFLKKSYIDPVAQSMILHQLNSPLTAIKWLSDVLLKDLDERTRPRISDIRNSAQILDELVRDLLNFSRIASGQLTIKLALTNIREIIAKVIDLLKPLAEQKKQKIILKFDADAEKPIKIDADLLSRAISNLIDNAIHYSSESSEIKISCDYKGNSYLIAVFNTGPPIPAGELKQLFTKFFRAEAAKKMRPQGSGLGLFIAKSAVEAHGGKIWCESGGGGVTFFIEIPKNLSQ